MFRVFLLSIGIVLVMAGPKDVMHKCGRLVHGGMRCCKKESLNKPPPPPPDNIKECFQMPRKPPSCDMEICIAKKKGVASDDGTIDKKAMAEMMDKELEGTPELAAAIKDNCVNGDLSKYGKDDFCELMKLKMCSDIQIIKSCDDWNDEGDCSGMKELSAECTKQFD